MRLEALHDKSFEVIHIGLNIFNSHNGDKQLIKFLTCYGWQNRSMFLVRDVSAPEKCGEWGGHVFFLPAKDGDDCSPFLSPM